MDKNISELLNNEWKEYSITTIEDRAIPSVVDGLKPVQRFLLYGGFSKAKNDFIKVAALAGNTSAYGFTHGEQSAGDALTKMAAYHSNNLPLFIGKGSFGNYFDSTPAATRYIFCKLNPVCEKLFLDTELAPRHPDIEHLPPRHYLPIIPMVLVNGISGIATGWAVDIPPHSPESIIDALVKKCHGKTVEPADLVPNYPCFKGFISREGNSLKLKGIISQPSPSRAVVKDVTPNFDYSSFEAHLDKLVDAGKIVDYVNSSQDDQYDILVTLKRGKTYSESDLIKLFKLEWNHKWNVNTISPEGKLQEWNPDTCFIDILNYFYDYRIQFVQQRIDNKIKYLEKYIDYLKACIKFIEDVVENRFNFKISDAEFYDVLLNHYGMPKEYIERTMNTPVRKLTEEALEKAKETLRDASEELEYFLHTTKEKEFEKNLKDLKKSLKEIK